ncbi:cytochrome P450 [Lophium mytilinum]|uniref:Cytochrome P450 n=1 Tax=Lophium mytilinum TaxID=390894 RepID=A0A6A6R635_9PEZI|nr:cytochrome P450 [Lophium mytilinum]
MADERKSSTGLVAVLLGRLDIVTAVSSALVVFVVYIFGRAIYDLYFGPLRKYPGPKLAAVSRFPFFWAAYNGDIHTWVSAQHAKYGKVVRITPTDLSYIDGQAWKDVYGHRIGTTGNIPKDPKFYGSAPNGVPSLVHGIDDPAHSRVRKIFANAFSDKALKEQEVLFKTYVDMLFGVLKQGTKKDPSKAFNMVNLYNFTTFDIMGKLTFGEDLKLLEKNEYDPWVAVIFQGVKENSRARAMRNFPLFITLEPYISGEAMNKKRIAHFNYSADRVDHRLAAKSDQPDIWNLVMRQKERYGLSVGEMHSNASLFMLAGTETTATLLSGVTFHLLKNPDKLAKLTTEIRTAFATEEDITIESLAQLKYLHGCLEEGLRMYPPVPVGFPRTVPAEGATICGDFIPGGTSVCLSQWAAYESELNFTSPKAFMPERWLDDERFAGDDKSVFQPFSYGPRNCLGKNLAYHEMRIILATVLWQFDLELCPESTAWADQKVYTLWDKPPLMCTLHPIRDV